MTVGYGGAATLTVAGGATVTSNGVTIGFGGSSNSSTATITGAGSSWMAGHMTIIGWGSSGRLIVEDGGFFKSNNINVGYGGGAAALIVRDGGRVEGSGLYLDASYAVGPVTVTVTGAGSTLTVLETKFFEGGLLTVENGGRVQSGQMELRGGSIIVTGAGSILDVSGADIELGLSGRFGTLTIEAGGEVKLISLMMGSDPASSATLNLLGDAVNGRGVLEAYRVVNQGGTVTLNLNGGILRAAVANNPDFLSGFPALTIGANGAFFDSNGFSIGVSTSFDGTGGLTKQGAGTLTLTGTNTYTGATTIEGGTLLIDAAPAMSAASGYTVASGATLQVSDSLGAVTAASIAGAGSIRIGTGTTLKAGGSNTSTTFSGSISGNGALDKTGTGTLTLTGASTYTGGTRVSGGKLVVNGSITGSVTLDGGTLGGSGAVGAVSVGSGATVAPGNSIGTLTVSGNVSFAAGSTYLVEVNAAGQSDRIVASGSATLSGGTVQVLAENGNYAASTSYTILTASGGVTGTFNTVTSNLAFLTPSLSYGGTTVTLTMTRNDTSFGPGGGSSGGTGTSGTSSGGTGGTSDGGGNASPGSTYIAATRNQGFIAVAAERLGVGNPVYDALISATAAEARAGFDLLSGEAHAQAVSVMIDESRLVRDTILGHLRGPLLTQAPGQVAGAFTADLPGRKGAVVMPAPVPQPRYAFWGTAFGSTGNTDGDGNAASLSRRSGGALLGADLLVYDVPGSSLKLGVAGGYSQSRFDLDARLS
ncbi:MAG: autotransporter outer membrane beta-barrel domain-containing protein, partial [Bosea sp.]|uniref:autotransporter outer membrane beta-barrel domain-containing protein n=2 Tax=Bosea sp. (in: a-proteobacteria) TaxID=1871050 RepID=UPI0031FE69B2|nr:autotransporter outer membrane beta-barrel domain-containing protein [Bosea sp. (in: a-proteobacteria)]